MVAFLQFYIFDKFLLSLFNADIIPVSFTGDISTKLSIEKPFVHFD